MDEKRNCEGHILFTHMLWHMDTGGYLDEQELTLHIVVALYSIEKTGGQQKC